MIEVFLGALILAKIKKYPLRPFFKSWVVYPILFSLGFYIILEIMIFKGNYQWVRYSQVIHFSILLVYLLPALRFELYMPSLTGTGFMVAGSILNQIAIHFNHGKMPIFPSLSYITGYVNSQMLNQVSQLHIVGDAHTRLYFLTDILDLGYTILSVGDILIRVFPFLVVYCSIKKLAVSGGMNS
jgi:hypothetical protein